MSSVKPPQSPNWLIRGAELAGVRPEAAAGNYARLAEILKNFATWAGVSSLFPAWFQDTSTVAAIGLAGAMTGFYGELGKRWLGENKRQLLTREDLSWLGELVTGFGIWKPDDAMNNATNILNVVGTLATMFSRAQKIEGTICADALSGASIGSSLAMAGFEGKLYHYLYKPGRGPRDAGRGVVAGGGSFVPNFGDPSPAGAPYL